MISDRPLGVAVHGSVCFVVPELRVMLGGIMVVRRTCWAIVLSGGMVVVATMR